MPRAFVKKMGKLIQKEIMNYRENLHTFEANQEQIKEIYCKDKEYWNAYFDLEDIERLELSTSNQIKFLKEHKDLKEEKFLLELAEYSEKLSSLNELYLHENLKTGISLINKSLLTILSNNHLEPLVDEGEAHRANNPNFYHIEKENTKDFKYKMVSKGWKKGNKILKKVKLE